VAEVRSLVVAQDFRRVGLAARLVGEIRARRARPVIELCAFTHDPRFFVRQNFSIVPHVWLPEKIAHDCHTCPLFRRCEQFAMLLPLRRSPALHCRTDWTTGAWPWPSPVAMIPSQAA
jgi:N-acetylglutamate synthase-like GNAT family acetyltransferase